MGEAYNSVVSICLKFLEILSKKKLVVKMVKVKAHELRGKKKEELSKQLEELKQELGSLRVAKVTGGAASKLSKIRVVRKSIARVLTVTNQKQKAELRKKLTRAKRRTLTPSEKSVKSRKESMKMRTWPK